MLEVDIQPNGKLAYPLEINGYPERLDLPDIVMQEAVKNRVKLIVNTDSHDASQMPLMRYGCRLLAEVGQPGVTS